MAVATGDPAIGESRSRRSAPTTTTPTSAGRIASSSATRIELDLARRDFTVNAIAWGAGAGGPTASGAGAGRSARRPRRHRGRDASAPSATRERASRRTRSGCSAPSASRPRSSSRSSPRRSPASEAKRRPRPPPVRRADRGRAREAARGRPAVGRPAAAGRHRAARRDLARSSRPSAACPRTRSRARTSGITPCAPSTPRPATGRSSGWPRCCTTSASRRRIADGRFLGHDVGRCRAWPASSSSGCAGRARERERVVHLVRHHMFGYEPAWSDAAVRRFIAQDRAGRARRPVPRCARRTTSASGVPADAGELDELRARVGARARRRASSSTCAAWRSTATT